MSGETVVDERDDPTSRQAVYAGLGNAARSVGDILLEDAPAGPTVRIPRDSDVAVVFARPPGAVASTLRVEVPGWALTTSPGDVALRHRVGLKLRPSEARAALARRFPAGTARAEIAEAEARGDRSAVDRLAAEVLALAHGAGEGREAGTA